jgi:hypothetical protein
MRGTSSGREESRENSRRHLSQPPAPACGGAGNDTDAARARPLRRPQCESGPTGRLQGGPLGRGGITISFLGEPDVGVMSRQLFAAKEVSDGHMSVDGNPEGAPPFLLDPSRPSDRRPFGPNKEANDSLMALETPIRQTTSDRVSWTMAASKMQHVRTTGAARYELHGSPVIATSKFLLSETCGSPNCV